MNLDNYKVFIHLASTLHFARTAAELHVSPSALTRTVQRLEEEVGHALLVRDKRRVRLTPSGERFRRFAKEQLAAWEALQSELGAEARSPSGPLRVACTVTACYSLLPRLIARCRAEYPRIALTLTTQDAARSLRQLEAAEVDLAVVPIDEALSTELLSTPLGETSLVFIAPMEPTSFTRHLQDGLAWEQVPLVAPLFGLERRRLDDWLQGLDVAPQIAAEVRGNEGIIALVSMGCGVGLVPELVLERSPQADRVVRLDKVTPPPGYQVGLCVRRWALKTAAVQAFWQLAQEVELAPSRGGAGP